MALAIVMQLIAWKEGDNSLLVDPEEISCLQQISELNENAHSIFELYPNLDAKGRPSSFWNTAVVCPSRTLIQKDLNVAIQKIESQPTTPPYQ